MKKLYIIDFMNIAFRNYHAFAKMNLTDSRGEPTGALFGTAQFVINLIKNQHPDYIVVAMESDNCSRREIYPRYKENRVGKPSDFEAQLKPVMLMFYLLGIPMIRIDGLEADDVIGSIVTKFKNDVECYIVSGDKDFMQLVDTNVNLFIPKSAGDYKLAQHEDVMEKFGCTPEQVVDVLALMGDKVDCIPGVQGIGAKGAAKIINEFGSLDKVYESDMSTLSKSHKEKLIKYKDDAFMSRQLAQIVKNAEIPHNLNDLSFDETLLRSEKFLKFCDHYSLKSIKNKIFVNLSGLD